MPIPAEQGICWKITVALLRCYALPMILCNNIAVLHKKGTILCSRNDVWPLRVLPDLIRHLTLSCVFYRIVWDCGSKPAKTLHQGSGFTHKCQSLELALVEFGNIFHSLTLWFISSDITTW